MNAISESPKQPIQGDEGRYFSNFMFFISVVLQFYFICIFRLADCTLTHPFGKWQWTSKLSNVYLGQSRHSPRDFCVDFCPYSNPYSWQTCRVILRTVIGLVVIKFHMVSVIPILNKTEEKRQPVPTNPIPKYQSSKCWALIFFVYQKKLMRWLSLIPRRDPPHSPARNWWFGDIYRSSECRLIFGVGLLRNVSRRERIIIWSWGWFLCRGPDRTGGQMRASDLYR